MNAKARSDASLSDIAEKAGVSISTVSKVANGQPDVAPATRTRIEALLREHRYVSPKRRQRTERERILFLSRTMTSPLTLEVLRGASEEAALADADLVVTVHHDDDTRPSWIDELQRGGPAAVIAVRSMLDETQRARFRELDMPLVVVDPYTAPDGTTYSVGVTNWAGGLEATDHLIALGHRRIGMLTGIADAQSSLARQHGYLAALSAAGIVADPELVRHGEFSYESGLQDGLALLALTEPPTAVFAASDFQAAGVIEAARQRGVRVPDELSVVGFDDQVVARMTAPPLTTVRQPSDEMGAHAVRVALQLLRGHDPVTRHTELATTLVRRESARDRKLLR